MPDLRLHFKLGDKQTTKDSDSLIKPRQWSLLTVNVIENKMVQIFVNSKLDIELLFENNNMPLQNRGIFYMGGDPWHAAEYTAFLDNLQITSAP